MKYFNKLYSTKEKCTHTYIKNIKFSEFTKKKNEKNNNIIKELRRKEMSGEINNRMKKIKNYNQASNIKQQST